MNARPYVVTVDGNRLAGELITSESSKALLVVCHGIPSGNPDDPASPDPGYPGLTRDLATRGFDATWFDFRGVRSSEGNFSVRGWENDLHGVLDYLVAETKLPIVIVGSSGSGPTALRVAADRTDIGGVATFAGVADWTEEGFLPEPETLLLHFRNIGIVRDPSFPRDIGAWGREFETGPTVSIDRIKCPILIVHGEADTVVPYHHAEVIYDKAPEPKELARIPDGAHQLRRDERAVDALVDWLDRHF